MADCCNRLEVILQAATPHWPGDDNLQAEAYVKALQHTYPEVPPNDMASFVVVAHIGSPKIVELGRQRVTQAENQFGAWLSQFHAQLRAAAEGDLLA